MELKSLLFSFHLIQSVQVLSQLDSLLTPGQLSSSRHEHPNRSTPFFKAGAPTLQGRSTDSPLPYFSSHPLSNSLFLIHSPIPYFSSSLQFLISFLISLPILIRIRSPVVHTNTNIYVGHPRRILLLLKRKRTQTIFF